MTLDTVCRETPARRGDRSESGPFRHAARPAPVWALRRERASCSASGLGRVGFGSACCVGGGRRARMVRWCAGRALCSGRGSLADRAVVLGAGRRARSERSAPTGAAPVGIRAWPQPARRPRGAPSLATAAARPTSADNRVPPEAPAHRSSRGVRRVRRWTRSTPHRDGPSIDLLDRSNSSPQTSWIDPRMVVVLPRSLAVSSAGSARRRSRFHHHRRSRRCPSGGSPICTIW